ILSPFKCKVLASLSETFLINQYISFMSVIEKLNHEKSLQALSNYGRMEAVELEKEIDYEIS
ncbi:hypothetical protein K6Y81_45945, partial [Burkholderia cenocepacia]|nr:hypothetical protein [Burkholderia cenocepacia]